MRTQFAGFYADINAIEEVCKTHKVTQKVIAKWEGNDEFIITVITTHQSSWVNYLEFF